MEEANNTCVTDELRHLVEGLSGLELSQSHSPPRTKAFLTLRSNDSMTQAQSFLFGGAYLPRVRRNLIGPDAHNAHEIAQQTC